MLTHEPITTERLTLRLPSERDLPHMPAVFGHPDIHRFTRTIPYPYTPEVARESLERFIRRRERGDELAFFLELNGTGELIGATGIIFENQPEGTAEIGYVIGHAWWGKGYATEAARAAQTCAFESFSVDRVVAHAMADNPASAHVLEKLGMTRLGFIENVCTRDGRSFDAVGYQIGRPEWREDQRAIS